MADKKTRRTESIFAKAIRRSAFLNGQIIHRFAGTDKDFSYKENHIEVIFRADVGDHNKYVFGDKAWLFTAAYGFKSSPDFVIWEEDGVKYYHMPHELVINDSAMINAIKEYFNGNVWEIPNDEYYMKKHDKHYHGASHYERYGYYVYGEKMWKKEGRKHF